MNPVMDDGSAGDLPISPLSGLRLTGLTGFSRSRPAGRYIL